MLGWAEMPVLRPGCCHGARLHPDFRRGKQGMAGRLVDSRSYLPTHTHNPRPSLPSAGKYLAEFSITYKPTLHGRPGLGATHSSRFIPLK